MQVNDHSVQHLDQVFPARGSAQKSSIRPQSASKDSFSHYTAHSMHNPPHNTHNSGSNGVPHLSPSSSANMAATASRYAAQLKSCEMRYVILKNELEESTAEEAVLAKKKHKIKSGKQLNALCVMVFRSGRVPCSMRDIIHPRVESFIDSRMKRNCFERVCCVPCVIFCCQP